MDYELKFPSSTAAASVLQKIGIDPDTRDMDCQDFEYTSCEMNELSSYYELYHQLTTTALEKRVLGCYLLQSLNDHLDAQGVDHPLQKDAIQLLYKDKIIHRSELDYWAENDWKIATFLNSIHWKT